MAKRSLLLANPTAWVVAALILGVAALGSAFSLGQADKIDHIVTAFAVLLGGGWTLYQFALRRAFESALTIDYQVRTEPLGQNFVVFFQVTFANVGNRRITAPLRLTAAEIEDYEDSVSYPADLQIKKLAQVSAPKFAGWWSQKNKTLVDLAELPPHISLLYEYSAPTKISISSWSPARNTASGTC